MPIFLIIVVILGIVGTFSGVNQPTYGPSDIILSTPSGGLVKNDARSTGTTPPQVVTPVENTTPTTPSVIVDPEPQAVEVPPNLDTFTAQDIDKSRATLRGSIEFIDEPYTGSIYFIYDDTQSEVNSESEVATKIRVSTRPKNGTFSRTITGLSENTTYYYRICFFNDQFTCGDIESFSTLEDFSRNDRFRTPYASTQSATNVQAETVTLRGAYTIYESDTEYVAFFVYGTESALIDSVSNEYVEYEDVDETGESLQKVRAKVGLSGQEDLTEDVDDLERNTRYYYRFCVDYENDEVTGMKCGSRTYFDTKSRQQDVPSFASVQVSTLGNSAEMSAAVSMEDYLDGHVFLVYGTSQSRVNAVSGHDEFSDVRQYGDELQRISLDIDFDGSDSFNYNARDLITSDYYYRFCVEYEGEDDRGRDDLFLACSSIESFTIQ